MLASKHYSNEDYVIDHFGRVSLIPTTLLIESFAQAASWLVEDAGDFAYGVVLAKLEGVRVLAQLRAGAVFCMSISIEDNDHGYAVVSGQGLCVSRTSDLKLAEQPILEVKRMMFAPLVKYTPWEQERERTRFKNIAQEGVHIPWSS